MTRSNKDDVAIDIRISESIAAFKIDCRHMEYEAIVQKHIISGECYGLTHTSYFDLRKAIAIHFEVHPNEIVMVGSAKLGFSIAPTKRFKPFGETSDIDIAIVSEKLFDGIWQQVHRYAKGGGLWATGNEFKEYLFNGWIRPDKLPRESGSKWFEFFRTLTNSGRYGQYKIAAGLYRTWYFLEAYQSACVSSCKEDLESLI